MSELCSWDYTRHAYCVVYHDNEGDKHYFSPGLNTDHLGVEDMFPDTDLEEFPEPIQDDDNVQMLIYRVQLLVNRSAKYLYFYIASEPAVNMAFDYTYKIIQSRLES